MCEIRLQPVPSYNKNINKFEAKNTYMVNFRSKTFERPILAF